MKNKKNKLKNNILEAIFEPLYNMPSLAMERKNQYKKGKMIDGWNLSDEIIREIKLLQQDESKFFCYGGECKTSSGDLLLRTLLIDRGNGAVYRGRWTSEWCPEEHKEWMLRVFVKMNIETIERESDCREEGTCESGRPYIAQWMVTLPSRQNKEKR